MATVSLARADGDHGGEDHERARRARDAGKILSLETILSKMEPRHRAHVLDVDLDDDGDRWEYTIEVLERDGNVVELTYDAASGALLNTENEADSSGEEP